LADGASELDALQMLDSTTIRRTVALPAKRRIHFQTLGRSRGGFTTKIHLRCNAVGLSIGVVLPPRDAHDVTAYDALTEQRGFCRKAVPPPLSGYEGGRSGNGALNGG
jgi:hypothetical protein